MLADRARLKFVLSSSSDPYWSSVVSLVHLNGSSGSTSYVDQTGKSWTSVYPSQIITSDSVFGGGCLSLSNSHIYTADSNDWDFGTGDFTVEFRVKFNYPTDSVSSIVTNYLSSEVPGWTVSLRSDGGQPRRLAFHFGDTQVFSAAWSPTASVWYAVAVSRISGVMRAFINGSQIGTSDSMTTNISGSTAQLAIGQLVYNGTTPIQPFYGLLDELRITKGVGRYLSGYTIATTEFPNS